MLRRIAFGAGAALIGIGLFSLPAQSDVADYVTASSEVYTVDGVATKATLCPEGYSVISGGWRFTPEDGDGPTSIQVTRNEPTTTAPSMPAWWTASVKASESGTLRVTVVCAID